MQAAVPQLCVDYPVYREINDEYGIALLTKDLSPENLSTQLNNLLHNEVLYKAIEQNCIKARAILNWQEEEKKLIAFYNNLFAEN
jgi:hypothetical protein